MREEVFQLVELIGITDPLLLAWLDLYEMAFPQEERVPVSRVLQALQPVARGERETHILAATNPAGELLGLMYTFEPECVPAAFLWYFAVMPGLRGQGLGAGMYRQMLAHLRPGTKALIFDLEDPQLLQDPQQKALAERRIAFYRRQGARLLGGIHYMQRVYEHQPPLPLRVMVHPLAEIGPEEVFELARQVFAQAISQAGVLRWE